jgi:hypothetical protein
MCGVVWCDTVWCVGEPTIAYNAAALYGGTLLLNQESSTGHNFNRYADCCCCCYLPIKGLTNDP